MGWRVIHLLILKTESLHTSPSFQCITIAKMQMTILYLLASLAAVSAMPVAGDLGDSALDQRQIQTTSNDLKTGSCKAVTFIMARGSTEVGNMVRTAPEQPFRHSLPRKQN